MRGEGWKGEEQIFGVASDDSEFFGEGGNGMDLFGGFLHAKVETRGSCEASSHMLLVTQRSSVFMRGRRGGGRLHRRGSG